MKKLFLVIGVLMGGILLFSACSSDEGSVGEQLLGTNRINVSYAEDSKMDISVMKDTESNLSAISTALIGTLNDKTFGKTRSGVAFQLRLPGAIKLKDPVIDSVKLFLTYKDYYGLDTAVMQTARVYKLKNDLLYTKVYNAATEIASLLGDEVGSAPFNKNLVSDTIFLKSKLDKTKDSVINSKKQVDTILRHLVVSLDKNKIGQYILNASTDDLSSSANFIKYFKGLYVKTDDLASGQGTIYGFNIYNSFLRLYYRNRRDAPKPNDTLYKAAVVLPITDNSARFNTAQFTQSKEIISSKDRVHLQGIHGTKAKIELPSIKTWKDSTKVSINKAELTFKIAVDKKEAKEYPLPHRLELAFVDEKGKRHFLRHSLMATGYRATNGILNMKEFTYTFNIPEFLQEIVKGKSTFAYFELSTGSIEQRGRSIYPGDAKNSPARVILLNTDKDKPVFKVTYTKY